MATRTYQVTTTTGAATTTVQIQKKGRLKLITGTSNMNASGILEISTNPASTIATVQPGSTVIQRFQIVSGGGSGQVPLINLDFPVEPFQNIYLHQTGAGNICEVSMVVSE